MKESLIVVQRTYNDWRSSRKWIKVRQQKLPHNKSSVSPDSQELPINKKKFSFTKSCKNIFACSMLSKHHRHIVWYNRFVNSECGNV